MKDLFSDTDLNNIRQAVAQAEQRTSGEIVPYLVSQSERYDAAVWRGATLGALLGLLVAMLLMQLYEGWGLSWLYTSWGVGLLILVVGALGAAATAFIPAVKRGLAERVPRYRRMKPCFRRRKAILSVGGGRIEYPGWSLVAPQPRL